jgi:hypothetical protein
MPLFGANSEIDEHSAEMCNLLYSDPLVNARFNWSCFSTEPFTAHRSTEKQNDEPSEHLDEKWFVSHGC